MNTDDEAPQGDKCKAPSVTPSKGSTLHTSLTTDVPVVMTGLELRVALSDALKQHGLASVGDTARVAQGKFKKIPKRKHSELITKIANADCFASGLMFLTQDTIYRILDSSLC